MKTVDLFSGFGGFTLGAQMAGAEVVYAANHWPVAIDTHSRNHPGVLHVCQDLRQADWSALPEYDLLLAAPACQGHSSASQSRRRPYHDEMRATAWAVVDCAEVTQPQAIIVENVPRFTRWPLYRVWLEALSLLGYTMREHRVIATRHGVPQRRDRLFLVGLRNGKSVAMPLSFAPEPAFGPCLDETADTWHPLARAKPDARARMAGAAKLHGGTCLAQHVTGHRGVPLSEPIRTITTQDHWVYVRRNQYRTLTTRELARGMGFPDSFAWDEKLKRIEVLRGLGNAVCPPAGRDVVAAVMGAA